MASPRTGEQGTGNRELRMESSRSFPIPGSPLASSPPEPPISRPERSLRALSGLREQIRRAFLIDGVVAVALVAVVLVILAFFLDYFLVLPPGVRAIHLALSLTYLGGVLVLRLIRPGKVALPEEDLAILVESR